MTVYRVVVGGDLYGVERWANVFHINRVGAVDSTGVFAAFRSAYKTNASANHWLNLCPGEVSTGVFGVRLLSMSLQAVTDPGIPEEEAFNDPGEQNTAGGLPCDVSVVVSWTTARAGRSYRGRTYLPPFHSNQVADGSSGMPHLASAALTKCVNAADNLLDGLNAISHPLVCYSRKNDTFEVITGGYVDDEFDTQRRRTKSQPSARLAF